MNILVRFNTVNDTEIITQICSIEAGIDKIELFTDNGVDIIKWEADIPDHINRSKFMSGLRDKIKNNELISIHPMCFKKIDSWKRNTSEFVRFSTIAKATKLARLQSMTVIADRVDLAVYMGDTITRFTARIPDGHIDKNSIMDKAVCELAQGRPAELSPQLLFEVAK